MNDIEIRVEKLELIKTLEQNRTTHQAEYDEALKAYFKRLVACLEDMLALARASAHPDLGAPHRLSKPENHVDEYDRVLRMLKWHTEGSLVLSQDEFQNFIDDDWSWKQSFAASYTANTGKRGR